MKKRKGIILAGGSGTRLYPLTISVSKQLLPIYDKPMVFYPLSTLMHSGIDDILIISTPHDIDLYKKLLGDGSKFGISLSYIVQPSPDGLAQAFILGAEFLCGCSAALILGDNLFYGSNFTDSLNSAYSSNRCTIYGYHVSDPKSYGVIEFDKSGHAISIQEKPKNPKSNYAVPGLYFFDEDVVEIARNIKPSARGELEIIDVIKHYMKDQKLDVQIMGRGDAWLDTGTHEDLLSAAQFIETIETRQGLKVGCPEEIAYRNGWLTREQIIEAGNSLSKNGYGKYLLSLLDSDFF